MDHASTPTPPDNLAKPITEPILTLLEIVLAVVFGLIALFVLLTPPALGLANNGDFLRITTNVGLQQNHDPNFKLTQYVDQFRITNIPHPDHLNAISRVAVLTPVRLAKLLNSLTSRTTFDLRWLCAVYAVMYMLAMALWVRASRRRPLWQRIALTLAFAFIFLDLSYLVYFGSFYTETPSLIYLLCAVGCLLNLWPGKCRCGWLGCGLMVGFFLFCTLFAASKAQNAPLVFPLLVAGTRAVFWTRSRLSFGIACVLAVGSLVLAAQSVRDYDIHLRNQNAINTVFNGLLIDSPDREGDLKSLGLRPEWAAWAGRSQFTSDSPFNDPTFQKEYFSKISPGRMAMFYATHPGRLIAPLGIATASVFDPRLTYGNFSQNAGISAKALWDVKSPDDLPASARWKWPVLRVLGTWSGAKLAIIPGKIWFWLAAAVLGGALGLFRAIRCQAAGPRISGAALFCLALMLLLIPPICIAGDGTWEINKHVFLGSVVFDLMLLLLLDAGLSMLVGRSTDSTT